MAAASSWSHSPKSSLDRGFLLYFGAAQHQKKLTAARAGAPRCFEGKNTQRGRMLLAGGGGAELLSPRANTVGSSKAQPCFQTAAPQGSEGGGMGPAAPQVPLHPLVVLSLTPPQLPGGV